MKSIIEREVTFENNSDIEVTVTPQKSVWAFVKTRNEAKFAQLSTRLVLALSFRIRWYVCVNMKEYILSLVNQWSLYNLNCFLHCWLLILVTTNWVDTVLYCISLLLILLTILIARTLFSIQHSFVWYIRIVSNARSRPLFRSVSNAASSRKSTNHFKLSVQINAYIL